MTAKIEFNEPYNYYGVILLCIGPPVWFVFMTLLYKKRSSPLVQRRAYLFLMLQNLGVLVTSLLLALASATWPYASCQVNLWSIFIGFPTFALPLAIRGWMYCFRYYLTQQRSVARPSSFLMRHLWLLSPSFLFRFWIISFLVHISIPVGLSVALSFQPIELQYPPASCHNVGSFDFQPLMILFVAFYLILYVAMAVFLWKSKDAFCILFSLCIFFFSFLSILPSFISF
eukprot:TRINITY_DN11000_c0_g1_i2.p1 TRINITY_DN11000_c0_g1~~TRINITY_DN11000_c0_g1_i2.p1  ORF type:complete len:251 (-),score=12.54 TRINITY_DN11000_c0_g1_i2:13-699(-)